MATTILEQYLEEENLDVSNLDGKTISKTGQNLPSQKPTSSLDNLSFDGLFLTPSFVEGGGGGVIY